MRITYIHQHFRTPEEGGGQRPFEFARRLTERGHQVTVVRAAPTSPLTEQHDFDVIEVEATYANHFSPVRRIVAFATFAAKASVAAARPRADVVFASSTPLTVAVPGIIARLVRRAPLVFEVRDLWPEVPIRLGALTNPVLIAVARALERLAYRSSAQVIALSPTMEAGVRSVRPDVPITLIPNTSHVQKFRAAADDRQAARARLGVPADRTMLLYAGSLGVSYDPSWLLDLKAARPELSVYVLGEGATAAALADRAVALGLDPQEILLGPVSHPTVVDFYAAADLVVSSLIDEASLYDNSLNKVFDAFAAGRPLLFNHPGWLSRVATDAEAGWAVPSGDVTAAVDLLDRLSADDLDVAGKSSARIGEEQFSTERLTDAFEAVLLKAYRS